MTATHAKPRWVHNAVWESLFKHKQTNRPLALSRLFISWAAGGKGNEENSQNKRQIEERRGRLAVHRYLYDTASAQHKHASTHEMEGTHFVMTIWGITGRSVWGHVRDTCRGSSSMSSITGFVDEELNRAKVSTGRMMRCETGDLKSLTSWFAQRAAWLV